MRFEQRCALPCQSARSPLPCRRPQRPVPRMQHPASWQLVTEAPHFFLPLRRPRDGTTASSSRPDGHHRPRSDGRGPDGRLSDSRSDRERAERRAERERERERERRRHLSEFLPQELLSADVLGNMEVDLEELMLMEGIWQSLQARKHPPGAVPLACSLSLALCCLS